MRKIVLELLDVYVSEEVYADFTEEDDESNYLIDDPIGYFVEEIFGIEELCQTHPSFRYASLFAKIKQQKMAMVMAHGIESDSNAWLYEDAGKLNKVSGLIAKLDKNYGVIVLFVCNPCSCFAGSKNAVILFPDRIISEGSFSSGYVSFEVQSPLHGEVDSYIIDSCIEDLEAIIKSS